MLLNKIKDPFALIIFGASGDLAQVKVFPALYSLIEQKRLPDDYVIVGFARTKLTDIEFREQFRQSVQQRFGNQVDGDLLKKLLEKVVYVSGQYDDKTAYIRLSKKIHQFSPRIKLKKVAYFAVPPSIFPPIIANFSSMRKKGEEMKLILEKPFGIDMLSAQTLFHTVSLHFAESEIYLLDHYLGKEAVQSILSLRYANSIINLMLQGQAIANIQITAFEDHGIGRRLGYFNEVGIIKDMVQSHLLQILALVTMSIPVKESAESFQREKTSILSSLHFPDKGPNSLVIGQYKSYSKEGNIAKSKTETFAAMRLYIDQLNWYNVPIFLRTGKRMKKKRTEVVIEFKKLPFQRSDLAPNRLVLNIQPDERVSLQLLNKIGGTYSHFRTLTTSDTLACFGDDCLPEHARLLIDVMRSERMFFLSFAEVLAAWKVVDAVLAYKQEKKIPLIIYPDGASDLKEAARLPQAQNFSWY